MKLLLVLTSFLGMLLYVQGQFVPNLHTYQEEYDAFRYHSFAEINSRYPFPDQLDAGTLFEKSGYPVFLSLIYSGVGTSPYVGCLLNWGLWLLAALALLPLVGKGAHERAVFWGMWALLPEAMDWAGTTSKEPLVILLGAAALRAAWEISRGRSFLLWGALLVASGFVAESVRSVLVGLIALAGMVALQERMRSTSPKMHPLTGCIAGGFGVLGLYLVQPDMLRGSEVGEALSRAGRSGLERAAYGAVSARSVLDQISSGNRALDALAILPRGLAHLFSPLNVSPFSLPWVEVAAPAILNWASAAIFTSLAILVALSFSRLSSWESSDVLLASWFLVGLVLLGMSGVIHERYRAMVALPLLALGARQGVQEFQAHGVRRLAWATVLIVGPSLGAYLVAKA